MKQAKIQWLQDPNQIKVDYLNNVRCEANRHFRNKKKENLRAKFEEIGTNSKIKNIRKLCRDVSDFKKGYWPGTNTVRDKKGGLVADSHSISAKWRSHFSQLFIVRVVSDIRQTAIQTTEPLVSEPSAFETEMTVEKLKRHKSPGIDQISAEMIKAGG